MKIAFIIYDGMTSLDFIGVYDPVTRLKTMKPMPTLYWEICAYSKEVTDWTGLRFTPTKVGESLENYEMVIVPGGVNYKELIDDTKFIEWIRTAKSCKYKVSVCTGALLLGAAGFLKGKRATTHPIAYDDLRGFCESVVDERVVDEDDVITARGVTSSIDLGLHLCKRIGGSKVEEQIRVRMDYVHAG